MERRTATDSTRGRILVTGGAGFIGSHVVDALVTAGFEVTVLDDLSSGRQEYIRKHLRQGNVFLLKGDVTNLKDVMEAAKGVGSVLHLAGIANVRWSIENPLETREVNVGGTANALKACQESGASKLIFASSCAVYGNTCQTPIGENHPTNPLSPYAASKLEAENHILSCPATSHIEITCLRLFNVYGPRQKSGRSGGVIAAFAERLSHGKQPVIYGDGEQRRDFVYVGDVADAFVLANKGKSGTRCRFNIGSGVSYSMNQVLELVCDRLGTRWFQPRHANPITGEVKESVADIRLAKRKLRYTPKIDLRTGLRRTLPRG